MTNSYRESFEFLSRQRRPSYFFEQVTEIFFSSKERARYTFLQAPFFRLWTVLRFHVKKKRKKERINEVVERILRIFSSSKKNLGTYFSDCYFGAKQCRFYVEFAFIRLKKKRKKRKILAKSRGEPFEFLSVTENFLLVKGALTLIKAPPGIFPPFWLPKEGGNSSGMIRKCGVGPRCRWTEEEY